MKWLEEIYGLFVDDPALALLGLAALAAAAVVAGIGSPSLGALVLVVVIVGGLIWSVGRG